MTLNAVIAIILRFFTEFGRFSKFYALPSRLRELILKIDNLAFKYAHIHFNKTICVILHAKIVYA